MTTALEARIELRVERDPDEFELRAGLELDRGVLVLYGPSGAGKTIALRTLAGLVRPAEGFIRIAGVDVFDGARGLDTPPHQRGIGYVPQHDALFPFTDVLGNVGFGVPRRERDAVARPLLEELELTALAAAPPTSLSGGERRRVALARALAVEPRLLLLDEPFTGIDTGGRARLTSVLRRTLERRSLPAVLVTHDPETARALGDRVVVLERGRVTAAGEVATLL